MAASPYERERELDRRREDMALRIMARSKCPFTTTEMKDMLKAVREAGYRIIDNDRIIDHHAVKHIPVHDIPHKSHIRRHMALQFGEALAERGGIDFTERELKDGAIELRGDMFVIHATPMRSIVRDETEPT
jgi:hypothetical protein